MDDFYAVSWHTAVMIPACLPDLDGLDPEALKALLIAKHSESLEQHKSDTEQIEHLKLVIEKYRRMIFGRKSEKLTAQLEQLEFRLEEHWRAHKRQKKPRRLQPKQRSLPRLRQFRSFVPAPGANLFQRISREKWSPIFLRTADVPTAAVRCASSAKTFPNNWNAFPQASR
jgi:hypothetical protein